MSLLTSLYSLLALVLLANLIVGIVRVAGGPTRFDRMIAAQFCGAVGVAFLLLLEQAVALPALREVALVLALLAPVATTAFVRAHEDRRREDPS